MKLKVSALYKIATIIQQLQQREKENEISGLDTDLFLAEETNGDIWMSIKYFNKDGMEQLGGVRISDNERNVLTKQSIYDTIMSVKNIKHHKKEKVRMR
jgi:hypothetical protein